MWRAPLAALLIGVLLVGAWSAALREHRYPYSGDSASYVEMAESLLATGRPRVSPWALETPQQDAVPQPLFPPGLPVLVAALTPIAGDARTAATWPNRIAAALLPLLVLLAFRGYAPDSALVGVGLWALLSPGVLQWHHVAYSDVVALALAIVSLGALVRAEGRDRHWLAVAGLTAGIAYAVRNAALAVLLASAAALVWEWLRTGGRSWRNVGAWAAGAAVPLAALAAHNLTTFGALQPYAMPPSARPWPVNLQDWVRAQLVDLHVPAAWIAWLSPLAAACVLAVLLVLGLRWWWRSRPDGRTHRLVTVLGCYVAAGGALLVASRSRYEWADTIEARHALQYSWALALLAVVAVRALPTRAQRALGAGAALVLLLAAGGAVATAREIRARAPDAWLVVANDPRVVERIRALPPDTFLASNASVLFRLAAGRPVRLAEFGGGDEAFERVLADVRAAAGARPSAYLLWCHEHTAAASACAPVPQAAGPECRRLRGPPQVVALCGAAVPP